MGNDADRYRRFLNGDDNGLREIIDIYYNGLILYIYGIVSDQSETEDIVQETFVTLATKKPKYQEKYEFKTWLFTIARNNAYDKYEIVLKDADGNILDTYTINPETGIGTNSSNDAVDLPQTGMSGAHKAIAGLAALMTLTGVALIAKSRRKDEDQ